jgi:hypothetical protein
MSGMFELMLGIAPLVMTIGFITILYMMLTRSVYGRRSSSTSTMVALLVGMLIWLVMFPSFAEVLFQEQEPECMQEEWVDCELYNIPLEECEKDVTEEGPYYDVRTITRYTTFTCTRWDDGTTLQPRDLDEGQE